MKSFFYPQNKDTLSVRIGGKAESLLKLQRNHRVPKWIVLPVEAFLESLSVSGIGQEIGAIVATVTPDSTASVAERVHRLILTTPLSEEWRHELESVFGDAFVSVRSSAADEDGAQFSFAGIHESFLYVRGADAIMSHIRKVWASGYHERALLYRQEHGLSCHPVPMAVIVQEMIPAEVSGVIFTVDPTTDDPHKLAISALYGLGEGLVSAGLDADHIGYDKRTGNVVESISEKEMRYDYDEASGTGVVESSVAPSQRKTPALSRQMVNTLVAAALDIERSRRRPQDIEFCVDSSGEVYMLQSRDITTAKAYGPAAGNRQIWDNANIIESYSGVTSPMTFSFIRHAYAVVYHCFSEVMGIPRRVIQENQGVYHNMLGLFQGQVYYNLQNWYRLIQQFPGYNYNKAFMESMMGVKDKADDGDQSQGGGWARKYFVELPKLLGLVGRMVSRFLSIKRLVPAFNRHFDRHYEYWASLDFSELAPHELMRIYHEMEQKLLRNWKTPIINDFYVMIFYGTLKGLCRKWCGDEQGTLQNNLICGEGGIESAVPTRILMGVAARIKRDDDLADQFLSCDPEVLSQTMASRSPEIAAAVDDYLERYGFRCMNELKLEEPSLHETPAFVYQMIANYVRMDDRLLDVDSIDAREFRIRTEAQARAFGSLSPLRRVLFNFVLKHARRGVKNRENMRFARTKIYGLLRRLLNAVGEVFASEGILNDRGDIFHLTIDEVWDYVKGTAVTVNLCALAELRREEFDAYRASQEHPDDHFETYGLAYHRNLWRNPSPAKGEAVEDGALQGIGCSPGVVEGGAKVVQSPRDDVALNGEILVAARTDPGWVPLYPSVSGLLIERGSILSHSAIVAREMGIPAIVGIPDLLKRVSDGDQLRMDASTGRVVLHGASRIPGKQNKPGVLTVP